MNILLLHPKAEIREVLAFPLESQLSATVLGAENGAAARAIADDKKFVPDVLVSENTAEIQNFFAGHAVKGDFVLCANAEPEASPAMPGLNYLGTALYQDLAPHLVRILSTRNESSSVYPFTRISTPLLLKMNPLAADIYVRLSAVKYVKLFSQNDEFDERDLSRYRDEKKVDYLHIRTGDAGVFTNKLLEELKKLLASIPAGKIAAADPVADVVETIHELIARVGVTEEVAEAVKSSVAVTMKALGDFPAFSDILKNVSESNGKYIGKHTVLLTSVACAIACAMDWYSEATFEKLTMAAFMHDAALSDHDLCAVKDLGEFEKTFKGKFNQSQISEYRSHPERAALLLGHFKVMPPEVDKIVAQHHEHPMGSGFPAALSSNYLTPLSSLFIIAHDLTDYILDHPDDFNMDHFLDSFEKKYSAGHFKKIAKVLGSVEMFGNASPD
jgi:hypothetical protein